MNIAYHIDCMEYMLTLPDKAFSLAIVDPPYGITRFEGARAGNPTTALRKYGQFHTVNDNKPKKQYFDELFRISENQIIWGYNHLSDMLPKCSEFIFWFKHQPVSTYADGELAWTSFKGTAKCFDYLFSGARGADKDGRIHPTQKPIALYTWLLQNYAIQGDTIFDSHLGSGSSRIAAYDLGYDFIGCEVDEIYYKSQEKRFAAHVAQISLFI